MKSRKLRRINNEMSVFRIMKKKKIVYVYFPQNEVKKLIPNGNGSWITL